jgi:outer membrane murein-binding lipoprotein Lpp
MKRLSVFLILLAVLLPCSLLCQTTDKKKTDTAISKMKQNNTKLDSLIKKEQAKPKKK